jgi:PucR-like helix-turn-helix protein
MASTMQSRRAARLIGSLPAHLAEMMRPELPSLASEIIAEIPASIPEYAQPMGQSHGQVLRADVRQALESFIELIARPDAPRHELAEMCRRLGRHEAQAGRGLESLLAAYRVGVRVAWRRLKQPGPWADLSSSAMSLLADTVFDYMDELASQSRIGYLEEKACSAETSRQLRRQLVTLVLERPAPCRQAVEELAAQAGWRVPEEVTMIAVLADPRLTGRPLDGDMLAELAGPQPHLLVPGPLTARRSAELTAWLAGCRAAAGLTVPLTSAADSLRWARQALSLSQAGIIDGPLPRCEDHLVTLWLLADVGLAEHLARREFAALAGLSDLRRQQLTDTLAALLATRGSATQVAEQLGVHPQTVRYRIHQLEDLLGERFTNPENQFAMDLALRAIRLRDRISRPADPGGSRTW